MASEEEKHKSISVYKLCTIDMNTRYKCYIYKYTRR